MILNVILVVFAFRGTEIQSIANWVSDLEAEELIPYPAFPGTNVAAGFYQAYQGNDDPLSSVLQY